MKILKKIGAGILFIIIAIGLGAAFGELLFFDWKSGALWVASMLGGAIAVIAVLFAVGGCYHLLKYIFGED